LGAACGGLCVEWFVAGGVLPSARFELLDFQRLAPAIGFGAADIGIDGAASIAGTGGGHFIADGGSA
jgi:hypothetical protein